MAAYYATIVVKFIPYTVSATTGNAAFLAAIDTYLSSATVDGAVIATHMIEGGLLIIHGTTA
jgi:hypothetical protein